MHRRAVWHNDDKGQLRLPFAFVVLLRLRVTVSFADIERRDTIAGIPFLPKVGMAVYGKKFIDGKRSDCARRA